MRYRSKLAEVVPFSMMVMMEGCTIGLTILAKTAMSGGMSPFVFVVYTNALATSLLFPFSFLYHRERVEKPFFTFRLLVRIFFLGLMGIALSQNLAFLGLSFTSPIVVCEMGLLIPAFSFILSSVLRITKLDCRSSSFHFKVIGTLISFTGAIVVEHFKGPYIRRASSSVLQLQHKRQLFIFYSTSNHWLLGSVLLAASSLCVSIWNMIQVRTVGEYPQVMKIASFYSLAGTIQSTIFCLIVERDVNAWKLKLNMELLLIFATALFSGIIRSYVHISCTRLKGSLYVLMFQPFRIVWASIFGIGFFVNSLHYGSVIGAAISGVGYYTIVWGQIREDDKCKDLYVESIKCTDEKTLSLLQEDTLV
ncbi:hypothetical protein K2173_003202 [Erythroxylum novogranatense]|uniref:WAT1-related protein n=1 Tax=Erythroxylum novogranatense TaxID=1862640 RepID=A0AAV8SY42_9ROSI|nr:hypothetical protein K2173_003202 [Erythroxylum novogranatense]